MNTEEILIDRYGPLLTLAQVAAVLDRSPEGLRLTARGNSELGARLRVARIKIGRRVHFRAAFIAILLDGAPSQAEPNLSGAAIVRVAEGANHG